MGRRDEFPDDGIAVQTTMLGRDRVNRGEM